MRGLLSIGNRPHPPTPKEGYFDTRLGSLDRYVYEDRVKTRSLLSFCNFCSFTHIVAWDNTTRCPHVYFQNYIFNVAQGETKIR